ncbi:MAG TPA: hypothetical protein ENF50_04900 [Archaeoglobus veneficus]|nr:hypothetical protein [Archaeoglobus veneficus]
MSKSIIIEIPKELAEVSDILDVIFKNFLKKKDTRAIKEFREIVEKINRKIELKEIPDTLELLKELRK